jgi:hypothetical protein
VSRFAHHRTCGRLGTCGISRRACGTRVAMGGGMRPYLCVLAISCLVPAVATARPDTAPSETTSYRVQTLAVDGVALAFFAGGMALNAKSDDNASDGLMTIGVLGMIGGTPLVHGLRGHGGRTMGSLGMRLGLMTAGMFGAVMLRSDCNDPSNDNSNALFDPDIACRARIRWSRNSRRGCRGGHGRCGVLHRRGRGEDSLDPSRRPNGQWGAGRRHRRVLGDTVARVRASNTKSWSVDLTS